MAGKIGDMIGGMGPEGKAIETVSNLVGNAPEGKDNLAEEYKKTFFSPPGGGGHGDGGGGGGPPKSQLIIFLVVYIVIVVVIFLILGPIGGAIAGVVGFFIFIGASGLGQRIMQSKHFPAIVGMMILFGILGFVAYFYAVGGFQASSGLSYQTSQGFSSILDSTPLRALMNFAKNPFGLNPTGGQYEELPAAQTPTAGPNQAFTIETRGFTSTVAFEQSALSFFIKITNAGSQKISRLDLTIDSGNRPGCIVFNNQYTSSVDTATPLVIPVYDIPASSSKEISVTGGKIDTDCMKDSVGLGTEWKPNIPVDVFVSVKGTTVYSTASRLAVERIRTDYGSLLFQNGVLTQEKVGAVYQAGTALSINLDAGDQPILDSTTSFGLLMNWINNGAGKMPKDGYPILFIVTPKSPYDYGQCKMNLPGPNSGCDNINNLATGEKASCMLCDSELAAWCSPAGNIFKSILNVYSNSSAAIFDWACSQIASGTYHVCATTAMTEEFNVFNCNLNLGSTEQCSGPGTATAGNALCTTISGSCAPTLATSGIPCMIDSNGRCAIDCSKVPKQSCDISQDNVPLCSWTSSAANTIQTGENRHTDYITALAIYPYQVSAPDVDVKAYCTDTAPGPNSPGCP